MIYDSRILINDMRNACQVLHLTEGKAKREKRKEKSDKRKTRSKIIGKKRLFCNNYALGSN